MSVGFMLATSVKAGIIFLGNVHFLLLNIVSCQFIQSNGAWTQ